MNISEHIITIIINSNNTIKLFCHSLLVILLLPTAPQSVAIVLQANTTGINNTGIGGGALQSNTTGASNSAVGFAVLTTNTTGSALTTPVITGVALSVRLNF